MLAECRIDFPYQDLSYDKRLIPEKFPFLMLCFEYQRIFKTGLESHSSTRTLVSIILPGHGSVKYTAWSDFTFVLNKFGFKGFFW